MLHMISSFIPQQVHHPGAVRASVRQVQGPGRLLAAQADRQVRRPVHQVLLRHERRPLQGVRLRRLRGQRQQVLQPRRVRDRLSRPGGARRRVSFHAVLCVF